MNRDLTKSIFKLNLKGNKLVQKTSWKRPVS